MSFMIAAAGAMQAIGALAKGSEQSAAGNYNADVESSYAQEQLQQGREAAAIDSRKSYLMRGTILANEGGSGGTNSGSALDVLADQMSQGMLQEQNDIYSSELDANKYVNSANAERYDAKQARAASYLSAASALMDTGARESMYGAMKAKSTGSGSPDGSTGDGAPPLDTYDLALNYAGTGTGGRF